METAFLIYLLKVNIGLLSGFLIYRLSFRNDSFFDLKRFTLLAVLLISLLYPLIDLSGWLNLRADLAGWFSRSSDPVETLLFHAPEINLSAGATAAGEKPAVWLPLILTGCIVIWIMGMLVLFIRLCIELIQLFRLTRRCKKQNCGLQPVYALPASDEAFSFFGLLFIGDRLLQSRALSEVLKHEQTHIRQLHSLDNLLIELVSMVCWFNPAAWLLKREIRMNHEYLADRQVVEAGFDKKKYQYHLLGMEQPQTMIATLYHSFSVLPLKKRIGMLNMKPTQSNRKGKYLLLLPLTGLLLFGSNLEVMSRIDPVSPGAADAQVTISQDTAKVSTRTGAQDASSDPVFTAVAKMPEYPGGNAALFDYLAQNLKYPAEAQQQGKQGRVIVNFIVNTDGSLSDVNIVRSLDPQLDAEAVRLIEHMPKWIPGEQNDKRVRVKYTLPISFSLN